MKYSLLLTIMRKPTKSLLPYCVVLGLGGSMLVYITYVAYLTEDARPLDPFEKYRDVGGEEAKSSDDDVTPLPLELIYNDAFYDVAKALDELDRTWWPCEGFLVGMLRFGGNFGVTSRNVFVTDNDIDIMVEVTDEADWLRVLAAFGSRLLNGTKHKDWSWLSCVYPTDITLYKYKCKTSIVFSFGWSSVPNIQMADSKIGLDLHGYVVSSNRRTFATVPVCLDTPSICKNEWPLQTWGGSAPYLGLIVDGNGAFAKAKFGKLVVRSPYNIREIMEKMDGGKNNVRTPHLPPWGYCIETNIDTRPTYNTTEVLLSPDDVLMLCERSLQLKMGGFVSWSSYYSAGCLDEARAAGRGVRTPGPRLEPVPCT